MPSASGPEPLIGPCGPVRRRRGARDTRESFRMTTGRVDRRPKESGRGGIPSRKLYTGSTEKMVAERRTLHSTPEMAHGAWKRQEKTIGRRSILTVGRVLARPHPRHGR